jgi:signal transduction histidine kinase
MIREIVREFFSALADRRTWRMNNPYVLFGFLWGFPIPLFSIGLDLLVSGRALQPEQIIWTVSDRPLHILFLLHPLLFAIVFGTLGTIKLRQDARIEAHVRELAEANDKLKELDRLKRDLIANVSHELRTPLVSILGYTEMILDGRLGEINERQKSGLAIALRNIERLRGMIEELLQVATIESGRLKIARRAIPLGDIVDAAARSIAPEMSRRRLSFTSAVEDRETRVDADPELIQRVLTNLLTNAMKFTPEGGSVTLSADAPRDGRARLRIRDTGRGIPPDFVPRMFDRFTQADTSAAGSRGGTGLGLSIVKAILDAHGSKIEVRSVEGQGTEIEFDLACAKEEVHAAKENHGD